MKKPLILQTSPRMASLRQGMCSFLSSCHLQVAKVLNKGTLFNSQAEGQDSLRQAIVYDYNNKSNEKQVKETVSAWSQNWLLCDSMTWAQPEEYTR